MSPDGSAPRPGGDGGGPDPGRPVRLLLVTVGLGVGGTEGQLLELASRLDPRRFAVTVCALKGPGVIARELETRGVRVVALQGRGPWDLRVVGRLWRLLRAERPHIVHSFLFWANVACRVAGRLAGVPLVLSSYRDVPIWSRWYRGFTDRLTARWAHAVTCCSDAVRRQALEKLGGDPDRYVTIHNGVDLSRFPASPPASRSALALPPEGAVIGTVGRLLEPKKGIAVLLHAFARVVSRSRVPACHLVITGDGPARERLQAMAVQLGLERRVTFAGERRDVAGVLALMDLFVMPSLHEGFGIALIEAMAAARPVVATRVGGIPEIVSDGETGLLVEPGDPEALAAAMETLLAAPDRARRLGLSARRRVEECFTIEACVRRHAALYEELLAAGHGRFPVGAAAVTPAAGVEDTCSCSR